MKVMIEALLLALGLSLDTGCLSASQLQQLTPEQIKAYNDAQEDIYLCIAAIGPPANGSVMFVVVPKSAAMSVQLSPTCQIQSGTLGAAK